MLSKYFKLMLFFFILFNSGCYGISKEAMKLLEKIKSKKESKQLLIKPTSENKPIAESRFSKFSLHNAIKKGNQSQVFNILESKEVDINLIDSNGETPMDIATRLRDNASVFDNIWFELSLYEAKTSKEIKEKISQEKFVKEGGIEFFNAISNEDFLKLNEFLNQGFNPNVKYDGETPLLYAIRLNKPKVVSLLLKSPGININEKDFGGETPLDLARMFDRQVIVKLLKKANAKSTIKFISQNNSAGKSYSTKSGPIHVKGYYRKDGTYVRSHFRRR